MLSRNALEDVEGDTHVRSDVIVGHVFGTTAFVVDLCQKERCGSMTVPENEGETTIKVCRMKNC